MAARGGPGGLMNDEQTNEGLGALHPRCLWLEPPLLLTRAHSLYNSVLQ